MDETVNSGGGSLEDTVGSWLRIWSNVEVAKLNNRLYETQIQSQMYDNVTKYQNPQATAGAYRGTPQPGLMGWVQQNPLAAVLGAVVIGGLVYAAVK